MATIYRKTERGQVEIDTRVNRLAPRLRTALILVDGVRSDADLHKMIFAQPEETLQALLEQGYIEVVASSAARPTPASTVAVDVVVPIVSQRGFENRRRLAVRHLIDNMGPAGETIAMRIEKSQSWDELRPLLEAAQGSLQRMRGAGAAADFATLFLDTPPA
ncbi:MAG: hypothetical protein ABL916_01795 [Burkholderiaceae bacterium]